MKLVYGGTKRELYDGFSRRNEILVWFAKLINVLNGCNLHNTEWQFSSSYFLEKS